MQFPSQELCYCYRKDTTSKLEGNAAIAVFSGVQCFGWHLACKKTSNVLSHQISEVIFADRPYME